MCPLPRRRTVGAVLALLTLAPLLAACSPAVHLTAEPGADTVACAGVIARLPHELGGLALRETDAQGTAAWGTPSGVLLRCGIPTPDRSTVKCYTLGGVDFLLEAEGKDQQIAVLTTYGRSPGVQVVVDTTQADPSVVQDLTTAIKTVPATRKCL